LRADSRSARRESDSRAALPRSPIASRGATWEKRRSTLRLPQLGQAGTVACEEVSSSNSVLQAVQVNS
jgi:hypothetical protein